MELDDLVALVQIGFALLIGLLAWRLIVAAEEARTAACRQQFSRPEAVRHNDLASDSFFSTTMITKRIEQLNIDQPDVVLDFARVLAGNAWAESATVMTIDRFGIELVATAAERSATSHIPFALPLTDATHLESALTQLARQARAHQKGST